MKCLDDTKLGEYAKATPPQKKKTRRKITNGNHMDLNNKITSKSQVFKLIYLENKHTLEKRKY